MSAPAVPKWRRAMRVHFAPFERTVDTVLDDAADGEVVFMCGAVPARSVVALRSWAAPVEGRWELTGAHTGDAKQPRFTYRSTVTGRRLTVYRAAPWFGESCTPAAAAEAWAMLASWFASRGWALWPTPGTTGRAALANVWAARGEQYPVCDGVPVDAGGTLGALIRRTSGQGRVELFERAGLGGDELHKADGRFMYADLASAEMGVGEPRRIRPGSTYTVPDAYTFGRYRVAFVVPDGWDHVGLVGVRLPGRPRALWLSSPGEGATTWVDGCELQLLRRFHWEVRILDGWEWPQRRRPLRAWVEHLTHMRALAQHRNAEVTSALRAVVLHTIGALHGRGRLDEHETADADAIPADPAEQMFDSAAGVWRYRTDEGQSMPSMVHPEWSAHLWARARVRLVAGTRDRPFGLLSIDPAQLVACELDAIYTTTPLAVDDGRLGTFRPAGEWHEPWASFRTLGELHTYTGEVRK